MLHYNPNVAKNMNNSLINVPCLDYFTSRGGVLIDENDVIIFLKDNPFIESKMDEVVKKIYQCFGDVKLRLEVSYYEVVPELWLTIERKKTVEESLRDLSEFDQWFIPEVLIKATSFVVNFE